jgi:hypothetical protein
MIDGHNKGLRVLALGAIAFAVNASPAIAQSGTSGSGSIAQEQYEAPTPQQAPTLVPDSGTLPDTDRSDTPASGGPDAPGADAPTSNAPAATEPAAAGDGAPAPENVTTRETGAASAPAAAQSQAAALPFTGGAALPIAAGGLLLLVAGGLLRRRTLA